MAWTESARSDLLSRYRTALVRIEVTGTNIEDRPAELRLGTGVVVGPNGLIVTAKHVVGEEEQWKETTPGSGVRKRTVKVTGLAQNGARLDYGTASVSPIENYDLVLLWINISDLQPALLADYEPPDTASLVALLWAPRQVPEPVSVELVPSDNSNHRGLLTVRLAVDEGNSGSGLFDSEFRLAGIILNSLDRARALAIPVRWVKRFIDQHASSPRPPGTEGHDHPDTAPDAASRDLATEVQKLRQHCNSLARELTWTEGSHAGGWYELFELRMEINQFGDNTQCHRIRGIYGPEIGEIRTLPYAFRSAPEFGTCVVERITDEQSGWSSPDLPAPSVNLAGQLSLTPPATRQQMHGGFTIGSRIINSYAVTSRDAEFRGHNPIENTAIGATYPVRYLRVVVFFAAGYHPTQMRAFVARSPVNYDLPPGQWPEDATETARIMPNFFFDRDRGCAMLAIERYSPEHRYVLSWKLPPPPEAPWAEVTRAREQVTALLGLGTRERTEAEAMLSSIRDDICETYFRWRRNYARKTHLSLLAFDEANAFTRVVLTTKDEIRNTTFPWGVGVVGHVMQRRRPAFVDTRDPDSAGIYRKIEGQTPDRHLLCVPLPLPVDSDRRSELMLNRAIPCLVGALSCGDESGNMDLLKEQSGGLQGAVSSAIAERLLDLISRTP